MVMARAREGGVRHEREGHHRCICQGTQTGCREGERGSPCRGCRKGAVGTPHLPPAAAGGGSDQTAREKQDNTHTQGRLPADEVS